MVIKQSQLWNSRRLKSRVKLSKFAEKKTKITKNNKHMPDKCYSRERPAFSLFHRRSIFRENQACKLCAITLIIYMMLGPSRNRACRRATDETPSYVALIKIVTCGSIFHEIPNLKWHNKYTNMLQFFSILTVCNCNQFQQVHVLKKMTCIPS